MNLLDQLQSLEDLRQLDVSQLPELAEEIRHVIIQAVSEHGGHLASNLGMVEMTIAMLRVFDPPHDKLLFDVSHQTYAYKILTGRYSRFNTLRQTDGLSGFLKRSESEYDVFGAGHAGTAISAGLGFAVERDGRNGTESIIAIVGDASIANGTSLEALNNVRDTTKRLIVVLNDNMMSISKNVGALSISFGKLLSNPRYNRIKALVEEVGVRRLRMGFLRTVYHGLESAIKSIFLHNAPFESMGIRYMGPVDGHDIPGLINAFESARDAKLPVLVHIGTQKGRGYSFSEEKPQDWHSSNPFDIETGKAVTHKTGKSWSSVFGESIRDLADNDSRITAITAGMRTGTGLDIFEKSHPTRFHDVGICEAHQMTFAAGLSAAGRYPIVAVYSTFVQRSIDGIIHDLALQKLPGLVCLDRGGIVPGDGPTHHGIYDIALMRPIPNLVIMQPRTQAELMRMLRTAVSQNLLAVIRFPRGNCTSQEPIDEQTVNVGEALELERVQASASVQNNLPEYPVALWSLGPEDDFTKRVSELLSAQGIGSIRVDARFVKPLDVSMLQKHISENVRVVMSVEDALEIGGLGSAIEDYYGALNGSRPTVVKVGWPDQFVPHASSKTDLMRLTHFTPESAVERILRVLSTRN